MIYEVELSPTALHSTLVNVVALVPVFLTILLLLRFSMILFVESGRRSHYSIDRLQSPNFVSRGFFNIVTYGYNHYRRNKETLVFYNPRTLDLELRSRERLIQKEEEQEKDRHSAALQDDLLEPWTDSRLGSRSLSNGPTKRRRRVTASLLGPHKLTIARSMGVSRTNRSYLVSCIADALTSLVVEQQNSVIRGAFLEFVFRFAFCYVQSYRIRHLVAISADDVRTTLASLEALRERHNEIAEPTDKIFPAVDEWGLPIEPAMIAEFEKNSKFGYLKTFKRANRHEGRMFDFFEHLTPSNTKRQKWITLNSRGNLKSESKYVTQATENQNVYFLINWLLDDDWVRAAVSDSQMKNSKTALHRMEQQLLESMGNPAQFVDAITLPELHMALHKMKQNLPRITTLYQYFRDQKKKKESETVDDLRRQIDATIQKLDDWQPELAEGRGESSTKTVELVQWFCLKEENESLASEVCDIEDEVVVQHKQVIHEVKAVHQIFEIEEGLQNVMWKDQNEILESLGAYEDVLEDEVQDEEQEEELEEIFERKQKQKDEKRVDKLRQQGSAVVCLYVELYTP